MYVLCRIEARILKGGFNERRRAAFNEINREVFIFYLKSEEALFEETIECYGEHGQVSWSF